MTSIPFLRETFPVVFSICFRIKQSFAYIYTMCTYIHFNSSNYYYCDQYTSIFPSSIIFFLPVKVFFLFIYCTCIPIILIYTFFAHIVFTVPLYKQTNGRSDLSTDVLTKWDDLYFLFRYPYYKPIKRDYELILQVIEINDSLYNI